MEKLAVTVSVLFKLIVGDYGAVFSNRLFEICDITSVFFTCLAAECCLRVRRVLEHGGIHGPVLTGGKSACSIVYNCLL